MALVGYLDGYVDGKVRGWAIDDQALDSAVEIEVYANGILIGKGLANTFRPDLTSIKADGRCAFEIPADLDSSTELRAVANGRNLKRSAGFTIDAGQARRDARNWFEHRAPSHRNAIELFAGRWATRPDQPASEWGDGRVDFAAHHLGRNGRFDGQTVLELGPLEGRHTFLLEKLGAEVLAIESNADAYLKCLVVKEIAGMARARFMLGDFVEHLNAAPPRYDVVFCSGVLYHMSDPISLIEMIARVTDKCLVWTHVYDETAYNGPKRQPVTDPRFPHFELWEAEYGPAIDIPRFWGGNRQKTVWMRERDMLEVFRSVGLANISDVQRSEGNGHAAVLFTATRP